MTVILAKKEKGKIVLASDNQTSWGDLYKSETKTDNTFRSKILKIDHEYAILGAGRVQEISIFMRYCQRTKPKGATENDIFDFMTEFRDFCKSRVDKFEFETNYIIVFLGKIFQVLWGFEVQEKKNHATCGSGMFCANVALDMGADAKKAVEMAIKHDLYCGGEVQIEEIILS